jgi:putative addiction module killer protein
VIEIRETETFSSWLTALRDDRARAKIAVRVRRLAFGNPGDITPVGEGVSELRVHTGAGYRVYFVQRGALLIFFSAVETRAPRTKTSQPLSGWQRKIHEHLEDQAFRSS